MAFMVCSTVRFSVPTLVSMSCRWSLESPALCKYHHAVVLKSLSSLSVKSHEEVLEVLGKLGQGIILESFVQPVKDGLEALLALKSLQLDVINQVPGLALEEGDNVEDGLLGAAKAIFAL